MRKFSILVVASVLLMNISENTQAAETGDTSVTSTTNKVAIPLATNGRNRTAATSSSNKNSPSSTSGGKKSGGMSFDEILADFPDLTMDDIRACLAFAAERERRLFNITAA